jgi:hypothetical protein
MEGVKRSITKRKGISTVNAAAIRQIIDET